MASNIQIKTDLVSFSPVYNRQEIVVNETDAVTKALTGFQYVFDIYINGSATLNKRFQVPPDDVLGYGAVDIGRYCEAYCYSSIHQYNSTASFVAAGNAIGTSSMVSVIVKYGYSYLLAGVYTVVTNTVVGTVRYLFQGSLTEQELRGWTPNDYLCNIANGANGQFLTDMKTNIVSINNLGAHTFLTNTPTDIDYAVYKTYTSAGVLIQTVTYAMLVPQTSYMYRVATGPEHINNIAGATITGAQPVITSSVASYTVQLTNSANAVASEMLYFEIQEPCRYEQRRVFFENRFGSFDAFNFDLRSQGKREVERKGYKYDKYPIVTAGISRSYQDQSQVTNFVKTQDSLTIRCDYLTTDQNIWLKQLIESPELYLQFTDPTGAENYLAYEKVNSTSWVEKDSTIDKVFNLELEMKLSQANFRQRR